MNKKLGTIWGKARSDRLVTILSVKWGDTRPSLFLYLFSLVIQTKFIIFLHHKIVFISVKKFIIHKNIWLNKSDYI